MTSPRDTHSQPPPDQGEPAVPGLLAAELARLSAPSHTPVPKGFDDDILSMARARLRPRPVARLLFRVGTGLAAAAALALVAWLGGLWSAGKNGPAGNYTVAALDPARHVDIIDAFSLARDLRAGCTPDASWDITRDGTIDYQDVDRLRAMAVRLDARAGSGTGPRSSGGGT